LPQNCPEPEQLTRQIKLPVFTFDCKLIWSKYFNNSILKKAKTGFSCNTINQTPFYSSRALSNHNIKFLFNYGLQLRYMVVDKSEQKLFAASAPAPKLCTPKYA
jgi:hypothetical protein